MLEINYLKFLARAVDSRRLFGRLWRESLDRLRRKGRGALLRDAARIALAGGPRTRAVFPEEDFLALTNGSVAVFPGAGSRAAVVACENLAKPPADSLARYAAVVMVRGTKESRAFRVAQKLAARRWDR